MDAAFRRQGRLRLHRRHGRGGAGRSRSSRARGLFAHRLWGGDREIAALPVPIDAVFRGVAGSSGYPALGDANGLLPSDPARS